MRLDQGRYIEPNHVDVAKPDLYEGNLEKKRFAYLDPEFPCE